MRRYAHQLDKRPEQVRQKQDFAVFPYAFVDASEHYAYEVSAAECVQFRHKQAANQDKNYACRLEQNE
jgi:hypothetical protein